MKKALLALAIVGMVASASSAATLWMEWADSDTQDFVMDPAGIAAPATATLEIWVDLDAGDDLITYFAANEALPEVLQTGVSTGISGWTEDSTDLHFGQSGQQVVVGTVSGADPIQDGTFMIAQQEILLEGGVEGDVFDVTFWHETVGLLDLTGGAYQFAPAFVGSGSPHLYTYGPGSPGADAGIFGSVERNPLTISVVPEPASFALLALGGIALIRRR